MSAEPRIQGFRDSDVQSDISRAMIGPSKTVNLQTQTFHCANLKFAPCAFVSYIHSAQPQSA